MLCGGASRRMGRDKALIEVDGTSMVLRVVAALRAGGCEPVVAIGGDRAALEQLGIVVVDDLFPGEGPLGGVITALAGSPADLVVVASCDLPHLTGATVGSLVAAMEGDQSTTTPEVAVAVTDRPHPTCAAWRPGTLPTLRRVFDGGERRLTAAIAELRAAEIQADAQDLANVNTPGDLPQ